MKVGKARTRLDKDESIKAPRYSGNLSRGRSAAEDQGIELKVDIRARIRSRPEASEPIRLQDEIISWLPTSGPRRPRRKLHAGYPG